MTYAPITNKRIPYELDGTVMYYRTTTNYTSPESDITLALAGNSLLANLNSETLTDAIGPHSAYYVTVWFFFPEARTIEKMFLRGFGGDGTQTYRLDSMIGSDDTTNGMDGTWEQATYPEGTPPIYNPLGPDWVTNAKTVSFTKSITCLRLTLYFGYSYNSIKNIHLYGSKAAGETPDDLVFCETDGTEMTAGNDFGDRPEASTTQDSFKIKNISPTKTATNVNVTVTHTDFLLSLSETGPWTAGLDFTSLAPAALTETIYIKNELGQPPLVLGPKAAKVIATVGSWA